MLGSESYQLVIQKFMKSLQDGTLKPNDKIYSENQLARILGIPRAQVREVYSALSILGVLYGQQGKGTFFGNGNLRQNTEILYLMTLAAGSNPSEVVAVRSCLECGAAEAAARNRTEEDLALLERYAAEMVSGGDPRELAAWDTAFHAQLVRSSGNSLLFCLFEIVASYMEQTLLKYWEAGSAAIGRESAAQHLEITNAVRKGDGNLLLHLLRHHFALMEKSIPSRA